MADGVDIPTVGPGVAKVSSEEVTNLNAAIVAAQQVQLVRLGLRTADATAVDLPGDLANGLDVDVTRLPAVALDGATLVALETTELGAATLAALENVTVTVANPGSGQATETTLAAVLAAVDGLEGFTDGIEGLLGSLATISAALAHGTYAYAAGTAAATIDVPAGARVKRVNVLAGVSVAATVTIAGGATITIPPGGFFDEQIPGDAALGGDVVIGGTVQSWYVAWVV